MTITTLPYFIVLKNLDAIVSDPKAPYDGLKNKDFYKVIAGSAAITAAVPNVLPTAWNKLDEPLTGVYKHGNQNILDELAVALGIGLGLTAIVAQAIAYTSLAFNGYPEALLLPPLLNYYSWRRESPKIKRRFKEVREKMK